MTEMLHDRVVHYVASHRFPFPGQTTWPLDYRTMTNAPEPKAGIPIDGKIYFPDILVVDAKGQPREVGEVELSITSDMLPRLRGSSEAADDDTPSRVRHFFLYVPQGLEKAATALLDAAEISYAGIRGFAIASDGAITILPYVTPGDAYDHQ